MTDNEIIKALESEIRRAEYVETEYLDCVEVKDFKLALDLINRQKAEIERLNQIAEDGKKVKAEAVKEFAERLKKAIEEEWHSDIISSTEKYYEVSKLDNLVKEFTEGKNDE